MPLMFSRLLMTWLPVLLFVACAILVPWYCYQQGLEKGRLEVMAETNQQTIEAMDALFSNHKQMIDAANTASNRLLNLTNDRQTYDQATTKTLQEVLNETAALRAACVYDDDVMRQLENARQRAAKAAASGFDGALSGSDSTSK